MYQAYDKSNNKLLGSLSESLFQILNDNLGYVTEKIRTEFYIGDSQMEALTEDGVDAQLLANLKTWLGERDEMFVRFEKIK